MDISGILTSPETLTAIFTGIFAFIAVGGVVYKIIKKPQLEFGKFIKKRDTKTKIDSYSIIIMKKNKKGNTAKNCRGRLKLGEAWNADSRWGSSRLKECDIHGEEYLGLFTIKQSELCFYEGLDKGEFVTTMDMGKGEFAVLDVKKISLSKCKNKILTINITSENAKTPKPLGEKISNIISKAI